MDVELISRQVLRAMRAHRSQTAMSRRLGYASNVVYRWESGRRRPSAAEVFRAAGRLGIDPDRAIQRFFKHPDNAAPVVGLDTPEGVATLVRELKGDRTTAQLAERVGRSRHAVGRWLAGKATPDFADLLRIVEVSTARLFDFVGLFVDPGAVPALRDEWLAVHGQRLAVAQAPFVQAFFMALDLEDYRALPAHQPGWLARRLGLPEEHEQPALDALVQAGNVRQEGGRYIAAQNLTLDMGPRSRATRAARSRWLHHAAERWDDGAPGRFSYWIFGLDEPAMAELVKLHNRYFQDVRRVLDQCEKADRVGMTQVNLLFLDDPEAG